MAFVEGQSGTDEESPRLGAGVRVRGGKQTGPTEQTLALQLQLVVEREALVTKQNARLLEELAAANRSLEAERSRESDLEMRMKAAKNDDLKAKASAQQLQRSTVSKGRADTQSGAEAAQNLCELNEVHRKIVQVHNQLGYAVEAQHRELATCKDKTAARTRRCRRLEDALYRIVAEAQQYPELREAVESGIQKSGPLVHAVLKRGAERLALRELDSNVD